MGDYQKIHQILKDDHPTLHKPSEVVKEVDEEIKVLASQLLLTMTEFKGVGLSAVQCGILKKVIVMDTRVDPDYGVMRVLMNAEVIARQGSSEGVEGCLSYPGREIQIKRSKNVRVKYLDLSGNEVIEDFKGLSSICIQHEIDHTNGITFNKPEAGIK